MDVKLKVTNKIGQLPIDNVVTVQNGVFYISDTEYKNSSGGVKSISL